MRKFTDKRFEKLDEAISIYSCMRKTDDVVFIKISPELFSKLIAVNHPYVIYSRDGYQPHQYKGCSLEIVSNLDYVAVAYFNIRTGKLHDIREIKEEDDT